MKQTTSKEPLSHLSPTRAFESARWLPPTYRLACLQCGSELIIMEAHGREKAMTAASAVVAEELWRPTRCAQCGSRSVAAMRDWDGNLVYVDEAARSCSPRGSGGRVMVTRSMIEPRRVDDELVHISADEGDDLMEVALSA